MRGFSFALLLLITACSTHESAALSPAEKQQARLEVLAADFDLDLNTLQQASEQAEYNQDVIDAITRPWEAKPWHQYREIFLTESRLEAGLKFWDTHQETLKRAEQELQVPAQIIVAIIGVETYYGTYLGKYPVLDSLYTLGFHYPKRSDFFSREFAQYLQLAQEQGWDLREVKGSYAGAMGYGQFIPSSYRHYGIDFDGDQRVDMLTNPVDAIGSVANYFHQHHWQYGESVVHPVEIPEGDISPWLTKSLKPELQWHALQQAGFNSEAFIEAEAAVKLLALEELEGESHWLALDNFYVITRYNRSPLYAMAVYQFSEQLRQAYAQ